MHIKQVIIQGFKSFKEQTVLEPFDRGHNVVVGRNGSGKSNFFQAIQFVLSDEYSRIKSEDLQSFLYEGIGPRVVSAYVEIIFDNSDGRFPVEKKLVCVRRSFGSKKDQYFLNAKLVSRNDIMNLLESAGFSKSNPYYIVKQGKINQMATAPDSHRLKLLREVAGTKVYDEKCKESRHLLKEAEGKIEAIDKLLISIVERLKELEEEKEELKEFQQWDNKRRYLEYTIYDRGLMENRQKLHQLQESRHELQPWVHKLEDQLKLSKDSFLSVTKSLKEARKEVNLAKAEKETLSGKQEELLKTYNNLKFMRDDLNKEIQEDGESRKKTEKELEELNIQIARRERELEIIKPQYEASKTLEEKHTKELAIKEIKRTELYSKIGKFSEFTDKEKRDEWITNELSKLEIHISENKKKEKDMNNELQEEMKKRIVLAEELCYLNRCVAQETTSINNNAESYDVMTKEKDKHQAKRKEQYQQESNLQREMEELNQKLEKVNRNLRSMVGNSILNGWDSVLKVIEAFREQEETASETSSYHGLLIDNFKCNNSIYTAVEVTAGNRLFHHLIETDSFSTKILKEMNDRKLPGVASFIPLNRISVRPSTYPNSNDAIPMVSKINYRPEFDHAFRFVFGRTLICCHVEAATNLARSSGLDCVTVDGDQVSSRGFLTGGYFDASKSRIQAFQDRLALSTEINEVRKNWEKLTKEIKETDNQIITCVTKMQKAESKKSKSNTIIEQVKPKIVSIQAELTRIDKGCSEKKRILAGYKFNLEKLTVTRDGFENQLKQELRSELSAEDQQEVDILVKDIRRLHQENKETFAKRINLEAEKNMLEHLLNKNLLRRRDEATQLLQDLSVEHKNLKLLSYNKQIKETQKQLDIINAKLEDQKKKVSDAVTKQDLLSPELENWKSMEKDAMKKIQENAKSFEKLTISENIICKNIEDLTTKISALETLPNHNTYSTFTKLSTTELLKEIEAINKELKKYRNVNMKALEQHMSFSNQRESLTNRRIKIDSDFEKIKELMMVLEQRKYEAILFTFKQVSKYFSEVFAKLVPSGAAQLVMQTKEGEEREVDADSIEESTECDKYCGIGIRVSFTGQETGMTVMNQLSGGQKSIVALALIFAIQKCDPAPFYLFDEIDQALDTEHRLTVANMVHELSQTTQFITTTFRPELLTNANKFYGIKFRNKVSHIERISLEEANDFVQDNTIED